LRQQKIYNRIASNDVRVMTQTMAKYNKKIDSLKSMKNMCGAQIGQLESKHSDASTQCNLLDGEVENKSHFVGHDAVESLLREITCSICSEYFVMTTTLSCSHVF